MRMRLYFLVIVCLLMVGAVPAQIPGFSDTFDDPTLPGWEHSPDVTVVNGWLHIEPQGYAFHGGAWNDMMLTLVLRLTGDGSALVKYRATDQTAYVIRFSVGALIFQRQSTDGSLADLGSASLEIPPGEPAMIVITVFGGQHQISVNGNNKITATDPQALPPGGIFLSAETAAVEFDEITLLPSDEAVQTQSTEATPTSEPAQPSVTSAAQSTSGVPAYQAESWVALGGPPGDLGYDIRYNFDDHNTWYVTDGQGGFFISTDRGLTWKASNSGIGALNNTILRPVFSATVDPHNPQTIWIGTQIIGHIYKSTDGGQSWTQKDNGVKLPNAGHHFRGFTVDPSSSDIVYAMAEVDCPLLISNCPPPEGGRLPPVGGRIYKTVDGGENWDLIWEGDALARYLWIDPSDFKTLYVSTGIFDRPPMQTSPEGVGILKSADGGQTWKVLGKDNGLSNLHVGTLYMNPKDSKVLLAGAGISNARALDPETGKDEMVGGVFLTTDGGEHWTKVIKNDAFGAVEFCDQDPTIAYAAGMAATYRSEDGGKTWQKFGDEQRETWGPLGVYPGLPIDIQVDPDDCSRLFINNYIGGNFLSADGAETWTIATSGYSGAQVYNVSVDSQDAAHVYATTRMAPFVSLDGGLTWRGMSDSVMKKSVSALAVDPSNANHLLASQGRGFLISQDGGQSWQLNEVFTLPAGIADDNPYWMAFENFAFSASNPLIVYATSRNDSSVDNETVIKPDDYPGLGIYRSNDGGATWQPVNDSNTDGKGFGPLVVHPADPQTVYVASHYDDGVLKTTDGGKTWTSINNGLPQAYERFYSIAMAPGTPDTLIITGRLGVFKTTDGGGIWKQLTNGLDAFGQIKSVVYDPTNNQVVYLGSTTMGVYYSTDGGEYFQPLTQGLDTSLGGLPIKALGISADGSVLYAATHGSGVWRLGVPTVISPSTTTGSATQVPISTPQPQRSPSPCGGAVAIPLGLILLARRRPKPE